MGDAQMESVVIPAPALKMLVAAGRAVYSAGLTTSTADDRRDHAALGVALRLAEVALGWESVAPVEGV